MKKTLIALAALAAVGTASAQSTVTLSGILKGGVAQTKYSNGTVAGATNGSGLAVADGSSRFILSGSEDLGGGLRANFQADTRFRVDDNGGAPTSSPLATGNTFVGLSGGFGALQLGKLDTHYCLGSDTHGSRATALQASSCGVLGYVPVQAGFTAAAATAGAPAVGAGSPVAIANASRSVNTLRYTTPNFGGFTAQVNYSTAWAGSDGDVGDAGKGRAAHGALNYAAGPLRAGLSLWDARSESRLAAAARNDQRAMTAMVDWNFGMGSVGLTWDRSRVNAAAAGGAVSENERDALSVPVTFKLGTGTLLATYTRAADVEVGGAKVANTGANLWSVGYDYPLSRRTSVGVSYARLDNEAGAGYQLYTQGALNGTRNNSVGQDANQFYVGVRHTF